MMNCILFCIISALALTLSNGEEFEVNANGCPTDFTIPWFLPSEYCNKFYQCVNGEPRSLDCPVGLVFNREEQVCDWPKNVECEERPIYEVEQVEEDGNNRTITVYGDPALASEKCKLEDTEYVLIAHEHCDKFYKCWAGSAIEINCPDNLLFNIETGVCDWPADTDCQDRFREVSVDNDDYDQTNPDEVCRRSQYNGALLPHDYCNWFYMCSNSRPVVLQCPLGLVYNIEEKACDWSFNVDCGNRTIAPIDTIEGSGEGSGDEEPIKIYGHSDPSQAGEICKADGSDGILVAHEDCNKFYKCWNGEPHVFDCNPTLHYNPDNGTCDWPQNVDCGDRIVEA